MSLQVYAGHKSGSKAAVHTMREIFKADETDAALLVDASIATNSLNRTAALHNIRVLCPTIAIYAINIYRAPSRLLVIRGNELESSGVQRKGSLYPVSLQPLITRLSTSSSAKQCWYAVDATGSGSLGDVKKWWDEPSTGGSALGYFPNAKKCWLIAKPEKEDAAREIFRYTAINITSEGHKYLGAAIGSRGPFLESPENSSGPKSHLRNCQPLILEGRSFNMFSR